MTTAAQILEGLGQAEIEILRAALNEAAGSAPDVPEPPAPVRLEAHCPDEQRNYILVIKTGMEEIRTTTPARGGGESLVSLSYAPIYYRWAAYPADPEFVGLAPRKGNVPKTQRRSESTAVSWALTKSELVQGFVPVVEPEPAE